MPNVRLERLGETSSPLLIADGIGPDPGTIAAIAAALAPFPPARGTAYPGLRRPITPADGAAAHYAQALLRAVAPYINRAFDADGFDLLDASFSIVVARPETLAPQQRAPHFDSTDPYYLAILHYLSGVAGSGTAFYRQRATGIECVSDGNVATFVAAAQCEASAWSGYIADSNASFDRIGRIAAEPGRLIVYPGSLLHSGLIPRDAVLSSDPRKGRLTGNFFVRIRPRGASLGG